MTATIFNRRPLALIYKENDMLDFYQFVHSDLGTFKAISTQHLGIVADHL